MAHVCVSGACFTECMISDDEPHETHRCTRMVARAEIFSSPTAPVPNERNALHLRHQPYTKQFSAVLQCVEPQHQHNNLVPTWLLSHQPARATLCAEPNRNLVLPSTQNTLPSVTWLAMPHKENISRSENVTTKHASNKVLLDRSSWQGYRRALLRH